MCCMRIILAQFKCGHPQILLEIAYICTLKIIHLLELLNCLIVFIPISNVITYYKSNLHA